MTLGIGTVGLAVAVLALDPQSACARPIILEDRAVSTARVGSGGLVNADAIEIPVGPFAIYGTLEPHEQLDAYEFVAPETAEISVALLAKEGLGAGEYRLTLMLTSAEGTATAQEELPEWVPTGFDWESLDTLEGIAYGHFSLVAGETYTLAITPGTFTTVTLPYVVEIGRATDTTAAPVVADVKDPTPVTSARLWLGLYGQRGPRAAPIAVAILLGVVVLLIVVALLFGVLGGALRRIARLFHPRPAEPPAPADPGYSKELVAQWLQLEPEDEAAPSSEPALEPALEPVPEPVPELIPAPATTLPAATEPELGPSPEPRRHRAWFSRRADRPQEEPAPTDDRPVELYEEPEPDAWQLPPEELGEPPLPSCEADALAVPAMKPAAAETPDEIETPLDEPEKPEAPDEPEHLGPELEWPAVTRTQHVKDVTRSKLDRLLDRGAEANPVSSLSRISPYLDDAAAAEQEDGPAPEIKP